jgi:ParB/RepB/Spo0J family partition protein
MTATKTATRAGAEELPMGEPLPDELQISRPAPPAVEQKYVLLPTEAIKPSPHNPRRDLGDLDGLVASIRSVGIQEPLLVEWASPADPYALLAGHRRLAAAKLAGLADVPCLVRQGASTPALRMEIALIENLQREGLAPLDEADGYLQLTKLGLSQRQIAERVGCSQSNVSKKMDLLALPEPMQSKVGKKGGLTLEAAAALTRLKDHPERLEAAAKERPDRIIDAVEAAEKEIAWEAKRDELVATAAGRSWPVVDAPRDSYAKRPFKLLSPWGYTDVELDVGIGKHEAEPCHAVMIPKGRVWPHHEAPSATSVCTDPDRHGPKGESTLKAKVAPKPKGPATNKEWEKERARREKEQKQLQLAGAARKAVLAKAVVEYKGPRNVPAPLTLSLRTLVKIAIEWDLHDDVCELLGIAVDREGEDGWELEQYVAAGDQELHRAAFAVTVVESENNLRWESDLTAAHFAYLKTLGYEPSPIETQKLAEAAKRTATGG